MVRAALCRAHGWPEADIEIIVIRTTGDQVQDRALSEIGGKALWTKELDQALLSGRIDAAVHSMKDVETWRPDDMMIAAMLPRADVRDRLIGALTIQDLPEGARVGTSSPRRTAQLLRLRPDLRIELLRGNVDTRAAAVASGRVDATLLAAAGLDRLGRHDVGVAIETGVMLPAPAQGAVGVETRREDEAVRALVTAVSDPTTVRCVAAERALLAALAAGCHSPVAALATPDGADIRLAAELLSEDGTAHVASVMTGPAATLPEIMAADLMARAPEAVRRLFGA